MRVGVLPPLHPSSPECKVWSSKEMARGVRVGVALPGAGLQRREPECKSGLSGPPWYWSSEERTRV